MSKQHKTFLVGGIFAAALVVSVLWMQRPPEAAAGEFSRFTTDVDNGIVTAIVIRGHRYTYTRQGADGIEEVQVEGLEPDLAFHQSLQAQGIVVRYEDEGNGSRIGKSLLAWFPMIIVLLISFYFMRQSGGMMQRVGKSKARRLSSRAAKVTFENVAGIDEARDELKEIIAFLKDPKRFERLGGRIPKGVLLMGPPGTGKTLLARAIAGEAGVPFFSISGSDFSEMFAGVGASRVRDMFAEAKKEAPCIVFIDEIDAVGRQRGSGFGGGQDEHEQTLNQLLVEMDGFEANDNVIIVAATNRPDILDSALLRPGRFDRIVALSGPDIRGREGILAIHTKRTPMAEEVSLSTVARGTPGFSGADLENLVNEAALLAARGDKESLDSEDFEAAKDKVLMGIERRSLIIGDMEKRSIAYHEAGHTLAARLLLGTDPVHKVTIVPRGQTLGLTQQLPLDDSLLVTKRFAQAQIAVLMGGRIAEELVMGEISSGSGQDIRTATGLAQKMVCEWGMSNRLGPVRYGRKMRALVLGPKKARNRGFSSATGAIVDDEVHQMVMKQYNRTRVLIEANLKVLTFLAETLLKTEVLTGAEVDDILVEQGAKGEVNFG